MKILITGAGGLVGGHAAEYFSRDNDVVALGHREFDISDRQRVFELVAAGSPDVIVNCAVAGVDECEADPGKAHSVNVEGPANLARAAAKHGAAIVHMSSNYVFDGRKTEGYYTIDDEPRPVNIYGSTKYEGENAVVAECRRNYIIRTSWVFGGTKRTFFNKAISALRRGEPLEAIEDNWACTTYVADLAQRISQIVDRGRHGTYHVVNGGICSKYDFAVAAATEMGIADEGIEKLVKPVRASVVDGKAARPMYTPMRCELSEEIGLEPMRHWTTALRSCVEILSASAKRRR
jgi:dTDP-4-dehydrorhamnose reductase